MPLTQKPPKGDNLSSYGEYRTQLVPEDGGKPIDREGTESMTGAKASGPFAGGRGRRGEEYLEPAARCCGCNTDDKVPCGCPGSCRRVDERARARHARARQGGARGPDLRLRGATSGRRHTRSSRRSPVGADVHRTLPRHAGPVLDIGPRTLQAAGGVPETPVSDRCTTGATEHREPKPVKVDDVYPKTTGHCGRAAVPTRARKPGTGRSPRDPGARAACRRETHLPRRAERRDVPGAAGTAPSLAERKPRRTHRRQRSSNPASSAGARRCLTTACSATVLPPHRQDGRCPPRRHRGRDARQRRAPARKTGRKRYSARRTSPCSQDGARAPPAGSRTRPVGTGRSAV